MIPSLCEAALETERRCFSKVIFESNVTAKITRSSNYFSQVLVLVNGCDWGCIVRDLETIIVLVLLAFDFISQRSHHSLTLPRSRIRDSATATLTPRRHNSHQSGVISITDQLIFQNGKRSEVYRRNNNGPKTLPYGTPDTKLTSLLRQPSTITCCDRFDRNCVNIDRTEPPIPTEQSL